jgi:hypothetical protein
MPCFAQVAAISFSARAADGMAAEKNVQDHV